MFFIYFTELPFFGNGDTRSAFGIAKIAPPSTAKSIRQADSSRDAAAAIDTCRESTYKPAFFNQKLNASERSSSLAVRNPDKNESRGIFFLG